MYTGTCLEAKYSKNVSHWSKKAVFKTIIWCTYGCSCLCRKKNKCWWRKDVWICSLMVVSLDSLERQSVQNIFGQLRFVFSYLYFAKFVQIYIWKPIRVRWVFRHCKVLLHRPARCCKAAENCKKFNQICQCFMIFIVLIATCCSLEHRFCWCMAYDCKPTAKMLCKWQNWATLSVDMHLGLRDVVLKSGSGPSMLLG